jgi:hypothetical protein
MSKPVSIRTDETTHDEPPQALAEILLCEPAFVAWLDQLDPREGDDEPPRAA